MTTKVISCPYSSGLTFGCWPIQYASLQRFCISYI